MKFYKCNVCGKIIEVIEATGTATVCCNQEMVELIPGTSDGAHEKHVPVVLIAENKVKVNVGAAEHPMTKEHYIKWIVIETTMGSHRKNLAPGDKPEASFILSEGEKLKCAYAYCNIHLLWKSN